MGDTIDKSRLEAAVDDALTRMYKEAEPGLNYPYIKAHPEEVDQDWYDQHYLDSERQEEIVEQVVDDYDLTESESTTLSMTAILDYGPRGTKR